MRSPKVLFRTIALASSLNQCQFAEGRLTKSNYGSTTSQDFAQQRIEGSSRLSTSNWRFEEQLDTTPLHHFPFTKSDEDGTPKYSPREEKVKFFLRRRREEKQEADENPLLLDNEEQHESGRSQSSEAVEASYASERRRSRRFTIARSISATLSFICSLTLMVVILRSHTCLGSPLHRLLIGLSTADAMSSFGDALGPLLVPKEYALFIWNAKGNSASCSAQGFIVFYGAFAGMLYNWSLCFYYLAVIRYEKSNQYIRQKVEPFLHGISISIPIATCIYALVIRGYYPYLGVCFPNISYRDPSSTSCEDHEITGFGLPCGRSEHSDAMRILFVVACTISILTPIVFGVTMTMMYKAVKRIEEKMSRYGVGALRRTMKKVLPREAIMKQRMESARDSTSDDGDEEGNSNRFSANYHALKRFLSIKKDLRSSKKSNSVSQSRIIFNRALAFIGAYVICFSLFTSSIIADAIGIKLSDPTKDSLGLIMSILTPLQGFFNLCIFLQPKILSAKKNKRDNLTWFQAFRKSLMSRGTVQKSYRGEGVVILHTPSKRQILKMKAARWSATKTASLERLSIPSSSSSSSSSNQC